jgi:hypothetical protein
MLAGENLFHKDKKTPFCARDDITYLLSLLKTTRKYKTI